MVTQANTETIPIQTEKEDSAPLPFLLPELPSERAAISHPQAPLEKDIKIEEPSPKKEPSKASLYRWAMPPTKKCHPWHFFPISKCTAFRQMGTVGPLARIFEFFPLVCPKCTHPPGSPKTHRLWGGRRIISLIKDGHAVRKILGPHR